MPWRQSTYEERRKTQAAVAMADSVLRAARSQLAELEAQEHERVRLDALDAQIRAQTIRTEMEARRRAGGQPDAA